MKPTTLSRSALALLAACAALPAHAEDGPAITISGFGTAALTMSDTDQAEYIRPGQAAGVRKDARPGVDSNFGVQATAKWNETVSFTAQGLVRKYATDQYGAELAWAFAKYKASDDFSLRAGRVGLPIYLISDFRNVGYANTMLRPPAEVYRQVSVDHVDGVDVVYQHSFDDTSVTAQFAFGKSQNKQPGNAYTDFSTVTALHVVVENGPFTYRFGRADAKFSAKNNPSLTGLNTTLRAVGLGAIADDLKLEDIKGSFTSLGLTMDYKNFLVQTEYAKRKTESRLVHDTSSWYAMLGYRYGKFTPYYMYGDIKQDSRNEYSSLPTSGPLAPLSAGVNGAVKAALQSTNAVGLRWDFYKAAALKLQIDRISPRNGSGAFINAAPGFKGPVNVYAVGVDFVF
ncbi:hypothetical protein [Rugamonas rubra]|uniref:Porin n=1 Tax=Rugamonas rubra TaxID=758825 RepID=A0A1I4N4J7_9BURK|nr:hypothetical protein [Rugamonas rubra]SFM10439.1 hypothetical protein SAMN02982985_02764 [Rugamonas rubra]